MLLGSKRMLHLIALRNYFGNLGLSGHRARDRFLRGAIIEVLDLLVVGRFPMDEHADAAEQIIRRRQDSSANRFLNSVATSWLAQATVV